MIGKEYQIQRSRFRVLSRWSLVLALIAVAQVCILSFLLINPRLGHYFVTTRNGDVIPVTPLSAPIVTDNYIENWAALQAQTAFTLDFVKYNQELSSLQPSFTARGWQQFTAALAKANITDQLKSEKLVSSAVVTSTPVITKKGVFNGAYSWTVKVPMLVSFVSASAHTKKNFDVTLILRRVPVMQAKHGIEIDYFMS